jgi:hypothetical protein
MEYAGGIMTFHKLKPVFLMIPLAILGLCFSPWVAAQGRLEALALLAWSTDETALYGAIPDAVVTLSDGSLRQTQALWRLPVNGSPPQQVATGLNPQLSANRRWLTYERLDAQQQRWLWGINLASGTNQPLAASQLVAPNLSQPDDPAGRVYPAPDGRQRAILTNQGFEAQLWIGLDNRPARLVLVAAGEIFSDLAWRPDSQALVLIRTPLGSQTETAGELWRIDLRQGKAQRLSQNNVVDRSPVWRNDGGALAIVRHESWRLIPAETLLVEEFAANAPDIARPPLEAPAQQTPPPAIRVLHHASNTCRQVPAGQIDIISFEDYVKRVVPHEVYPSWPAETLKAQAVAARTYAWYHLRQAALTGRSYDVTDWVNFQYMCDTTVSSTNQAVNATAGEVLAYGHAPILAMFSAENSSPTRSNPNAAYLQAIEDPVSFGQTLYGHGYGLGQWGAQRWAARFDWSYQAILRHYYTGVTLEEPADAGDDPPNVAIVLPWSGHYLTTNSLYLRINASDDSGVIQRTQVYLSTPVESHLLIAEPGPPIEAGYIIDSSVWKDEVLANKVTLTAEAVDSGGQRAVSKPVTLGLDRLPPAAMMTAANWPTPTTVITTFPVDSLTLAAADATAGIAQLALGHKQWAWPGANFARDVVNGRPVGQVVSDPAAWSGQALQATTARDSAGGWTSSEVSLCQAGLYRAYVRLRVSNPTVSEEVIQLQVLNESGALVGLRRLRGADFRAKDAYQEQALDFSAGDRVTFRVDFLDRTDVNFDRLIVLQTPGPYTNSPSLPWPATRLKVIDGAGNVSNDLLVEPQPRPGSFQHRVFLPIIQGAGCS